MEWSKAGEEKTLDEIKFCTRTSYSWSDALCEWHTIKMYLLINENDHLMQQEEKAEEE